MSNTNQEPTEILNIIESALDLAGTGSKQVILDYLKIRYGMDVDLIVRYKDEFENYLRETLADSADVIISRINENLRHISNDNVSLEAAPSERADGETHVRARGSIHFLICDICFWCASILKPNYELKCQSCGSQIRSAVPVTHDEKFVVDVDIKRGITLSFHQSHK